MPSHPVAASIEQLQVFDWLQAPIWVFDIERLQMHWANQASLHLWNASSREELLTRNFSDVSDSTRIRLQTYLQQFEQGKTLIEQWTFYPGGGQPVSLPCHCSGIVIDGNRLAMLVQGAAETTYQVDQDTVRSIEALRHTSVMISLYTLEGVPVLQNPAALRCYADTTRPSMGNENAFLRHFVDPEIGQQAKTALESGEVFSIETQVSTLQGIRWHGLDARLTSDPATGQQMILVNEKDITAQQIALEELARATRMKDEFLANMSHELRTPLNAILGMTEGLQEEVFGAINAEQLNALQTIESSGSHLLELINDILDVAKIESGQIELNCTAIAIAPLCQSSLAFIQQQALKKHLRLTLELPPHLPQSPNLWADERRIRQVLINVLNNAVKFTPDGGQITLAVSYLSQGERSYLRLAITDTGIGIAPENQKKLFRPFIQIDSALNREYQGTGLGLALVKRLVELHGGQVGLTSQVGQGSCFTIDLPCTGATVPSPASDSIAVVTSPLPDQAPAAALPPLILLAEDNEANISTVSAYLEAKGYRILLAQTGLEAIALAESHHPDLILMDIQMPVMDGLEATQRIRHHPVLAKLPIIALTALALTGDRERCLEAGANDYLSKPVRLKELTTKIEQLLAIPTS